MSKTRDTGFLNNVLKTDPQGNVTIVSGSTTLLSISSSGAVTTTGVISGSNALTSSYSQNSELLDGLDSTSFVFTSSYNLDSSSFSTRTTTLEQASASFAVVSQSYSSASGSFSGRITTVESKYATTGSNIFTANQTICGNLTTTGTITAQTINVQQVTSSIVYSCGSNIFGCAPSDVQQMTGSLRVTGSGVHYIQGGCVGIGYTSPTVQLQVSGTIATGDATNGWGRISYNEASNEVRIQSSKNGTDSVGLSFWTQASGGGFAERMAISGSNVGIGCSRPTYHLEVRCAASTSACYLTAMFARSTGANDGVGDIIAFGANGVSSIAGMYRTAGSWGLELQTANQNTRMRIDNSGITTFCCQVGIGIAPCASLHANGNIISEGCFFSGAPDNLRIFSGHWATASGNGNCYLVFQAGGGSASFGIPTGWGGTASIYTCGINRLSVTTEGYVGIGTGSPNISGGLAGNAILTMKATCAQRVAILELNGCRSGVGEPSSYIFAYNNSCNTAFGAIRFDRGAVDGCGSISIATSGTDRVCIASNGNVSIAGDLALTPANSALLFSSGKARFFTGGSERLAIFDTGISCFQNTVCAPTFRGALSGNVNGYPILAQASCLMGGTATSATIYFTSNIRIEYGVNDYTVVAYDNGNSAIFSSVRALIPYNYYQSTPTTTVLASFIDNPNGHSSLSVAICKLVNSNTYCIAVRFATSPSYNIGNKVIMVTSNGIQSGFA